MRTYVRMLRSLLGVLALMRGDNAWLRHDVAVRACGPTASKERKRGAEDEADRE